MLSPKYTRFHVLPRCCSAAMSDGNILQTPKKTYPSSDNGNQSCCRLRGSVKDFKYCKNLFKKSNEELLAVVRRCMEELHLGMN